MLKCEMDRKSANGFMLVNGSIEDIIVEIAVLIQSVHAQIPDDMDAMAFRNCIERLLDDDSPVWERDDG